METCREPASLSIALVFVSGVRAKWNHFSNTPPWPMAHRAASPQHVISSSLIGSKFIPADMSCLSSSLFLLHLSLFAYPWFLPLSLLVPIILCCLNFYSSEPMGILFQQGLDKLLQLNSICHFLVCVTVGILLLSSFLYRVCSDFANTSPIEEGEQQASGLLRAFLHWARSCCLLKKHNFRWLLSLFLFHKA